MDLLIHKKRLIKEVETLVRVAKLTDKPEDLKAAQDVALRLQGLQVLIMAGFKSSSTVIALLPQPEAKEEAKPEPKQEKPKAVRKPAKKRIKKVEK